MSAGQLAPFLRPFCRLCSIVEPYPTPLLTLRPVHFPKASRKDSSTSPRRVRLLSRSMEDSSNSPPQQHEESSGGEEDEVGFSWTFLVLGAVTLIDSYFPSFGRKARGGSIEIAISSHCFNFYPTILGTLPHHHRFQSSDPLSPFSAVWEGRVCNPSISSSCVTR